MRPAKVRNLQISYMKKYTFSVVLMFFFFFFGIDIGLFPPKLSIFKQ